MIKRIIPVSALVLMTVASYGQSNDAETTTNTKAETVQPYAADEEAAARKRIEGFEEKINANRDNEKVNFEAELKTLNEMKARFNKRANNKFEIEK